jgi:hypothetical protein
VPRIDPTSRVADGVRIAGDVEMARSVLWSVELRAGVVIVACQSIGATIIGGHRHPSIRFARDRAAINRLSRR